jgi:cytochrome c biogenesis protein CcmG, thiol:disulfide interchange protein DsbE
MPTRRQFLSLVTAALLGLGWIGGAAALEQGAKAPEIGLTDLSGKPVTMASLAGKVVVVDFWATWCAPCKEELPVLNKLYKKYGPSGLVVIGVSVDEKVDNVRAFLKKLPLDFPIVHDAAHAVSGRYKPSKMPSSYIIDRKGIVRHVHGGYRSEDASKIESEIRALLSK